MLLDRPANLPCNLLINIAINNINNFTKIGIMGAYLAVPYNHSLYSAALHTGYYVGTTT
jgi:hypothetical protein